MKYTVRCPDAITARQAAEAKAKRSLHISAVFFVKGDPTVRDWVFTTVVDG